MLTSNPVALEPITITGAACRDWVSSSELEWLETNGTGAFAMGTVAGANTRRYHGLLVASLRPPVDRRVLLSRVEEEILCDGELCNLGAAQYPGAITPAGFQQLEEFHLDPYPVWRYQTGCATLEKRLFLVAGQQTVVLLYQASARCRFRLRPFLAFRDYHSLQHATDAWRRPVKERAGTIVIEPFESMPALQMHHNAAGFVCVGNWYYNNEYREEMDRGLDFREDLYSPGWFDFELEAGQMAFLVATVEPGDAPSLAEVMAWEKAARTRREVDQENEVQARLERAADQFLVERADGSPTVIAGYPWFTDWGRDTMISLPGLLTVRGKQDVAQRILSGFLSHLDRGLIPNRFPDAGESPEYNTADGTLWMFPAAWSLPGHSGSKQFLRDVFYPAAREILDWHRRGTHFEIRVDERDQLLSAGTAGTQLTWMDAKVGDWVVTPRHGKPVEINALWYNALRMTQHWAQEYGDAHFSEELRHQAELHRVSFEAQFWNAGRGCLFDRIAPEGPDARIRPNQVFALSLPFPLMNDRQQRMILDLITARLATPFGLRTLEREDPEYRGRYQGGPLERDGAYHQGTVWPWLMGPYVSARLHVYGRGEANVRECRRLVEGLAGQLNRKCLGQLAEIYDGDAPQRPVGAVAQAWSVAELLRVLAQLAC